MFLFNEIQAILGYESKKEASKCIFFLKMFGSYKKIAIFAPNSMLSGVIFEPVRAWVGAINIDGTRPPAICTASLERTFSNVTVWILKLRNFESIYSGNATESVHVG